MSTLGHTLTCNPWSVGQGSDPVSHHLKRRRGLLSHRPGTNCTVQVFGRVPGTPGCRQTSVRPPLLFQWQRWDPARRTREMIGFSIPKYTLTSDTTHQRDTWHQDLSSQFYLRKECNERCFLRSLQDHTGRSRTKPYNLFCSAITETTSKVGATQL